MFVIELDIKPNTENRLKKILGFSPDPEIFATKMIAYQISELKRGISNLMIDLKKFEDKYHLSSSEFFLEFQQGKTDDRQDNLVWAGLYEMLQENEQQLRELE
jgi:hypothetical protein